MSEVTKTENGVTYKAPSQSDWDRGVRIKVGDGGGSGAAPDPTRFDKTLETKDPNEPGISPFEAAARRNAQKKRSEADVQRSGIAERRKVAGY